MDAVRVEEVLGDFLHLRRRGVNFLANCPFHDEKTPSFTISPAKGIYKCFGCGKAGNSVTFVMEHENIAYIDAIRYLARKYNITLEETETSSEEIQKSQERESLFILNDFANQYFQKNLWENEIGRTLSLSYFKERGFSDKTIRDFQLGYCLDMRDELYKTLHKQGFQDEFIQQLGLAKKYDESGWRDFYRGRIMFPLHNLSGKVVGFAGRIIGKAENTAKYINSPENEIYHKSKVLYGLHLAKKTIPKENYCLLVEGYTDVISLYQAGVENVVASSGTALTIEQLKLIRRFTENLYLLYDGDSAGIKAALRGTDLALENGLNVNLILLPESHDPDSYVKEYGGEALRNYIKENATDIVTFKANLFRREAGKDPVKQAELTRDIIQTISLVPDNIKRSFYLKECALLMGIEEDILGRETQKLIHQRRKKEQTQTTSTQENYDVKSSLGDIREELETLNTSSSMLWVVERDLCKILLEHGDKPIEAKQEDDNPFFDEENVVQYIFKNHLVNFEFETDICKKIFDEVKQNYDQGKIYPLAYYLNHTDNEIASFAIEYCKQDTEILMNWNKNKKNKSVKIKNYGDNYRAEVDQVLEQVKIAYYEKLSQKIMQMTRTTLSEDNSIEKDPIMFIHFQQELIEQIKQLQEKDNYVIRKVLK